MRQRPSLEVSSDLALASDGHSDGATMVIRDRKRLRPSTWSVMILVWLLVNVCGTSSQGDCNVNLFDTYDQGQYVCSNHPDLVIALEIAEVMGREECQRAFARERWNCSDFSILKAPNITNRATKEAAYVYALSLAAIAHSVAKMCAMGEATSCSCKDEELELPQDDSDVTYTEGCSDNVDFGITFAKQFLVRRHGGSGLQQEIELHNMLIGASVVQDIDETPYVCHCVGVSGSCTVLTCQYELPEFTMIADRIGDYYYDNLTCKAVWNNIVGPGSTILPTGCNDRLLYYYESPDYCIRNVPQGSLGTVGRECDPHSTGHNSCNSLCTQCGRGYRDVQEEVENDCWCEFVFCCEIRCSKCPETRHFYVCT